LTGSNYQAALLFIPILMQNQEIEQYVRSSPFWDVTQHRLVFNYRRFWKTYQSHIQGSSRPLNMGLIGFPEISVTNSE
jgi:hypothetical protein